MAYSDRPARARAIGGLSRLVQRDKKLCPEKDAASMDHFSPVAPAHIRVLVLPVGHIEGNKFTSLVQRLQREASIVPLTEVEHRGDGDNNFLSPKAFPQGSLLYRFSATAPSERHQKISPYEFFREPSIVLGVVDGLNDAKQAGEDELAQAAAYLRERHPRVVHRQLIVLEDGDGEGVTSTSNEIRLFHAGDEKHPSLRSAITELSARFLVEFTTYAKAVQASPTIQTPGQTAKGLQRHSSLREGDKRPGSGHGDSSHTSSPTEDGRNSDSFSVGRAPPMPATSFDQMPSANNTDFQRRESEASTQSSKSKSRARSSSQDRVPTQGFGSSNHGERFVATGFGQSSSQEKTRARGKARVGIVMGSIHMMAGQWSEALRLLAESTTISHALTDHLWHAKGLENMLVCMILLLWSNTEFKVPKICDLASDKGSASKFSRVTSNPPGVPRESAESAKDKSQGHRLSVVVPGLAKKILTLLRSAEGSLELPFLVVSEASVRIAKVLAALNAVNGELTYEKLRAFVVVAGMEPDDDEMLAARSFIDSSKPYSKAGITEVLNQALPSSGGEALAIIDHVRLLAGVASVYSMVGFDRKKAMIIRDAVTMLTSALMQARKLGAAEMGIHPAASLSTDTGADTLLAVAAEGGGLANLMADISNVYGASLFPSSRTGSPIFTDTKAFGNTAIKFEVLRALAGFCEAAPDPHGVLLMTASLLRAAGPNAAIDAAPESVENAFSREEQMHLATVISRTVAVSRNLGLPDVQAVYWDPFLVRGVEILQPTGDEAIIDRTKMLGLDVSTDQLGPGNPLLYDPNASRPGTAIKQTSVLVKDEESKCVITLQNPFDIPIDIEELSLETDGLPLISFHSPTTLGPLRFQRVSLRFQAVDLGATKVTGCVIKMQGCVPQMFPIVIEAWSAKGSVTTKQTGLDARPMYDDQIGSYDLNGLGIEPTDVSVVVIPEMPLLMLESSEEVWSGLMMLEGETCPLTLQLRNVSKVPASVYDVTDSADVLGGHSLVRAVNVMQIPTPKPPLVVVPAGGVVSFPAHVRGRAGVASTHVSMYYRASGRDSKHARIATIPLKMTVNAALQVQNMEILHSSADQAGMTEVFVDIRNAWPRTVSYRCGVDGDGADTGQVPITHGVLAPGEVRRIHQRMSAAQGAASFEPDVDRARARFFSSFRLKWAVDGRGGLADLLGLPLSQESLHVLQASPIDLAVFVNDGEEGAEANVVVGSYVKIRVEMSNRGKRSAPLKLQLSDKGAGSQTPPEERRYSVVGTTLRPQPPLGVAKMRSVDFVICPRLAGTLDLEVVLEEMTLSLESNEERWQHAVPLSLSVYDEDED